MRKLCFALGSLLLVLTLSVPAVARKQYQYPFAPAGVVYVDTLQWRNQTGNADSLKYAIMQSAKTLDTSEVISIANVRRFVVDLENTGTTGTPAAVNDAAGTADTCLVYLEVSLDGTNWTRPRSAPCYVDSTNVTNRRILITYMAPGRDTVATSAAWGVGSVANNDTVPNAFATTIEAAGTAKYVIGAARLARFIAFARDADTGDSSYVRIIVLREMEPY